MGLRHYIPGTQARRDRLFQQTLRKEVGDKDGLAFVEWEDGSVTMKPVVWESDLSCIMDEDGNMWFAKGLGSEPVNFHGIHVWYVFAGNAGIISTEASLIAAEERAGTVIDVAEGDEVPDDLFELGLEDPNGNRTHDGEPDPLEASDGADRQVAQTDGGVIDDPEGAIYDLRPPKGYDGVAISVRDPDYYDPYPVTRQDAKAAAEWFEQAGGEATDVWMKGFIVGLLVFAAIWGLMTIVPWLLQQIGGSGGGGGGETVAATIGLLLAPYRLSDLVPDALTR